MKKLTFLLISALCFAGAAFASDPAVTADFSSLSDVSAKYLNINAGAAGSAMGDAYDGVANDASSIFWNPAGLMGLTGIDADWNLFISHNLWVSDVMTDYISAARNMKKAGVFGFGVAYFNAGSIDKYDLTSSGGYTADGTFSPYALSLNLSYANMLEKSLNYGINFKYLIDSIDSNQAYALAFDVGVRYFSPIPGLSLDIVAKNFGGALNGFNLAKEMIFGAAYGFELSGFNTTLAYEADGQISAIPVHRFGLEIKTPSILTLRAGYHTDNTKVDGFKGFTFGTGFNISGKFVDVSFSPYGSLGNAFQLSMGGSF